MKAASVASAVNSTTLIAPSRVDPKITPFAVILKVLLSLPVALTMSDRARFTESNTPIASRARYSTDVATTATTSSTNETANENFITDHGSMRLRKSRARRGPRCAAPGTPRRPASVTLAEPTLVAAPIRPVGAPGAPAADCTLARPTPVAPGAPPGRCPGFTVARPVLTDRASAVPAWPRFLVRSSMSSKDSGGGAMPGARVHRLVCDPGSAVALPDAAPPGPPAGLPLTVPPAGLPAPAPACPRGTDPAAPGPPDAA